MDYSVNLEVFRTMNDYQFKFPNYFKYQDKVKPDTLLEDYYYEIFNEHNCAFRISFKKLN